MPLPLMVPTACCTTMRWLRTTPLGVPVVPLRWDKSKTSGGLYQRWRHHAAGSHEHMTIGGCTGSALGFCIG